MGNLTIAAIFIVLLNLMVWFSAIAMLDINPTGSVCYHLDGSIIGNSATTSGNLSVLNNDIETDLPTGEGTISPTSGNVFTDIFNNILGWFKSAPGVKYVYGIVVAPYNILKCMNLPPLFVAGVGTLWYIISLLVVLAFFWGREGA